jgi:hypothetical protein
MKRHFSTTQRGRTSRDVARLEDISNFIPATAALPRQQPAAARDRKAGTWPVSRLVRKPPSHIIVGRRTSAEVQSSLVVPAIPSPG